MPTRAKKICAGDCGNRVEQGITYCSKCKPVPFARKSKRNEKRLSGWAQQRRAKRILLEYDYLCHVCGKDGANEVDHVLCVAEGGTDTDDNLRPIHSIPCHRNKTQAESNRRHTR